MSLHRSSSTSSFSSSSSTLLLHPLDIHFLAEPYGPPPPPGPAQPEPFQMGPPEGPPPAIVSSPAYITTSFSARILEGQSSPVGGAAEDVGDPAVGGLAQYKAMSLSTAPAMPAMPTSLPTTPTSQVPMKTSNLPKVQVCGRAGVWWALNAGVLLLYRDMHARGQCSCVRAEVVPLHKVPGPLQAAMVLEQEDFSETHALLPDSSRSTSRGYDRLTAAEEDANGNSSPAPRHRAQPTSTNTTTPTSPTSESAVELATPTTDMDVASTGSASIVESSSDYDHYMSQSESEESDDDDDDDEALTCNVCDRAFPTSRLLASHQTRKRHYGCSTCENVFPTLMSLEAHKEETNHWSDDDLFIDDEDDDDDDLDEIYGDVQNEEEREKLL
ncbi:uncharacterized protein LOC134767223 isoform X2 [Penaeus indicus]|uniref:uncharacterized protein LOC134767223 isoform X2 n=1 Tax=Penaeus indicus TaxID=29960 RepID=UPI00300CD3DA